MNNLKISVLLPAHNAVHYLKQSVDSILQQTFSNFEIIVVDDASTDGTAALLSQVTDPRLRVLRNASNLGIVGSLNRAMSEASGQYIARTDADDVCRPVRLARQAAFLDANPKAVLIGAHMIDLEGGRVRPSRRPKESDPVVLRWLLHIGNPVGHPSMMFRAEAVRSLGCYLRPEFQYAEDFDFTHRMLSQGDVALLPETLMSYRLHDTNITRVRRADMLSSAAAVLGAAYAALLGRPAAYEAGLVADHLFAGTPATDVQTLSRLGKTLDMLLDAFLIRVAPDPVQRARCEMHAAQAWWRAVENALRSGLVLGSTAAWSGFSRAGLARPGWRQLGTSALRGLVPAKGAIVRQIGRWKRAIPNQAPAPASFGVNGMLFDAVAPGPHELPSLTVVVDTEAEFDWGKPFDRSLTAVRGMAAQEPVQAIFDGFGLRPIYVVDYAVASQPEGYEPLRRILARRGCVIGAHLHPWITPPFEETVNNRNSYGGNLPPALEEAKLESLVAAIEASFGVRPLFFKAGRYGLGPHTLDMLARMGFEVDFSIMPLEDFRSRGGWADFRFAGINACRTRPGGILSVPMTRSQVGLLAPLPPWLHGALHSASGQRVRLPGLLSRLGLANTITLTPEGVTAAEQKALLRRLVRQGHRRFVLHYHSPSVLPGNTPYVRTKEDLQEFRHRLESVCTYFFEELGGLPGHPADWLGDKSPERLWPQEKVFAL